MSLNEQEEAKSLDAVKATCIRETFISVAVRLKDNGRECGTAGCFGAVHPFAEIKIELIGLPHTHWPQAAAVLALAAKDAIREMSKIMPEEYRVAFMAAVKLETQMLLAGGGDAKVVTRHETGLINDDGSTSKNKAKE